MNPDSTKTDADAALAGDTYADVPADGDLPSLSVVFEALSNARSRRLLYCLVDEADGSNPVEELALAIAAREADGPDATPVPSDVDRIRTALYHQHVPKLADASLVRYDEGAGTVTLDVAPEGLEPYLSLSRRADGA